MYDVANSSHQFTFKTDIHVAKNPTHKYRVYVGSKH